MNEKGVSNNRYWRAKSDALDKYMGWEDDRKDQSVFRGFIHGVYHCAVGIGKAVCGNFTGSRAEFKRAGEQFRKFRQLGKNPLK